MMPPSTPTYKIRANSNRVVKVDIYPAGKPHDIVVRTHRGRNPSDGEYHMFVAKRPSVLTLLAIVAALAIVELQIVTYMRDKSASSKSLRVVGPQAQSFRECEFNWSTMECSLGCCLRMYERKGSPVAVCEACTGLELGGGAPQAPEEHNGLSNLKARAHLGWSWPGFDSKDTSDRAKEQLSDAERESQVDSILQASQRLASPGPAKQRPSLRAGRDGVDAIDQSKQASDKPPATSAGAHAVGLSSSEPNVVASDMPAASSVPLAHKSISIARSTAPDKMHRISSRRSYAQHEQEATQTQPPGHGPGFASSRVQTPTTSEAGGQGHDARLIVLQRQLNVTML